MERTRPPLFDKCAEGAAFSVPASRVGHGQAGQVIQLGSEQGIRLRRVLNAPTPSYPSHVVGGALHEHIEAVVRDVRAVVADDVAMLHRAQNVHLLRRWGSKLGVRRSGEVKELRARGEAEGSGVRAPASTCSSCSRFAVLALVSCTRFAAIASSTASSSLRSSIATPKVPLPNLRTRE